MRPKKLLVLTSSFPRHASDSAGLFIQTWAQALYREFEEFVVLCPDDSAVDPEYDQGHPYEVQRFTYHARNKTHALAYQAGMPDNLKKHPKLYFQIPSYAMSCFFKAVSLVRTGGWHIHSHWAVPSGFIALALHWMTRSPLSLTLHSSDIHTMMSGRIRRWMLKVLLSQCENYSCVSEHGRKRIENELFHEPMRHVRIVPMGIERPVPKGLLIKKTGARHFVVFAMSRLVPIKGLCDLIQALSGRTDVELKVAGEGPEKEDLRNNAKLHGVRLTLLGNVMGEKKRQCFEEADIVVFPSRVLPNGQEEGTPVALMEAMAYGSAIVASATGGIPEVIQHNKNGLLFTPNSVRDLKQKIHDLLKQKSLRVRLSQQGKCDAERYYVSQLKQQWVEAIH